jgi:hypothetical protein
MCTYRHTKAYYEHLHSQIITYALTDTHGHVCEHRLTSRHTDKDEEFWLPDCKNAAGPQGWLTSALHLHSFEKLKPSQPSWTCFIPLLCTHFQMVKSTGWNLLSGIKRCQFSKLCLNSALPETAFEDASACTAHPQSVGLCVIILSASWSCINILIKVSPSLSCVSALQYDLQSHPAKAAFGGYGPRWLQAREGLSMDTQLGCFQIPDPQKKSVVFFLVLLC